MANKRRIVIYVLSGTAVLSLCALGCLATAVKFVLNNTHFGDARSPSASIGEARERKTWLCDVEFSPERLMWQGKSIVIKEAWVEAVAELDHAAVWIPYYRPVGGYYLCFTLGEGHEVFREYPEPLFLLEDSGEAFGSLSQQGRIQVFYYQIDDYKRLPNQRISLTESFKERPGNIQMRLVPRAAGNGSDIE
jgi:hypothetical protein